MATAPEPLWAPGLPPGGPPTQTLEAALETYKSEKRVSGKGQIATMIFASRMARRSGLPFDVATGIRTENQGQVRGLGKGSVQAILADYGITRVLAEEGGRTSRGSLGNIQTYLNFLNNLHAQGIADLPAIETWWIAQAQHFFNARPFALRFQQGNSLRSVIRDLLAQAKSRQEEGAGTMFVGAMLQHLIGAKLSLALPDIEIEHNGFSVADRPTGRSGDFEIGNASLHVTTTPGEAVIRKCSANLAAGRQPIIITHHDMLPAADAFASAAGIADRLDVLDAEQFLVANLHELGGFRSDQIRVTVGSLIERYNAIVTAHETDPSLQIASN
jgi:hypothetical protein